MKKIQLPAIGGVRKVIQPGSSAAGGTTIAEIGDGTITLNQLAALITQIQTQQNNNGGGNIVGPTTPGGSNATIVLGPGLTGGGVLVGNVPIRLTAPVPWSDEAAGADGDPGPPGMPGVAGANGATGSQGPMGPAVFLDAMDGEDGWPAIPGAVGPQGIQGATGPQGPPGTGGGGTTMILGMPGDDGADGSVDVLRWAPTSTYGFSTFNAAVNVNGLLTIVATSSAPTAIAFPFSGGATVINATVAGGSIGLATQGNTRLSIGAGAGAIVINAPTSTAAALTVNGISAANTALFQAGATSNQSQGVQINAGTSKVDAALTILNATGLKVLAKLFGDGSFVVGASTQGVMGTGTVNAQSGLFTRGVPAITNFMMADDNGDGDDQGFLIPVPNYVGPLTVAGPMRIISPTPGVSPGVTALGTTTTATVITTAGGIALPALASTFWQVNVNGVAYGIPCFAL